MKLYSRKVKFFIGVLIIVLILFLLNIFQKEVRSFFYSFSSPIQKILWRTGDGTSDFFEGIIKINSLKNEIDELKSENQAFIAYIIFLEELKKENEVLRKALEIELQKDFTMILTQVIGKDISQDFISIDKGSNDNVLKNMPVITNEKVLLGRISEVYNSSAKVMLISNKQSSFDIKIKEKDISGIAKGKGDLKVFIDLIPRDKDISQGDIVITSKLGGVFPDGLLVGEITEVKKNDIESIQQAEIKTAFDIGEIDYLFVIKEY